MRPRPLPAACASGTVPPFMHPPLTVLLEAALGGPVSLPPALTSDRARHQRQKRTNWSSALHPFLVEPRLS